MSVNTNIYLPKSARIRDIAKVAGILAGLEKEWNEAHIWVNVSGAEVRASSVPEMPEIWLEGNMIDGQENHSSFFHYEPDFYADNYNLLSPNASPFWRAIGRGLVDFFGGFIFDFDCDDNSAPDYMQPTQHKNNPRGDKDDNYLWIAFEKRIYELKPITVEDLEKY